MSKHQGKSSESRQQKHNERQTNVNQTPKTPQGGTGNLSKNWQQSFNNTGSKLQSPTTGKRK